MSSPFQYALVLKGVSFFLPDISFTSLTHKNNSLFSLTGSELMISVFIFRLGTFMLILHHFLSRIKLNNTCTFCWFIADVNDCNEDKICYKATRKNRSTWHEFIEPKLNVNCQNNNYIKVGKKIVYDIILHLTAFITIAWQTHKVSRTVTNQWLSIH